MTSELLNLMEGGDGVGVSQLKAFSGEGLGQNTRTVVFYCLLPVACTSSHTACTEPKPTHSTPILLQMFVFRERVSARDTRARWLGTTVLGRLPIERSVRSFIFLRWLLYRRAVFTRVLLYLVCLIHMVEKHWIDR